MSAFNPTSESAEEENAAELLFGSAFSEDVQTLTNDQLYFLMLKKNNNNVTEQYTQTFQYVETLCTTRIQDDLKSLAAELTTQLENLELERRSDRKLVQLHKFEISSLANLVRAEETSVEEVVSWIPSLARFGEDQIIKAVNLVVEAKQKVVEATA